jgi:hypothetical protein
MELAQRPQKYRRATLTTNDARRSVFSLSSQQGEHPLSSPSMTVKIVSIDTLKINKLCGIFKHSPDFVFLPDGQGLAALL